MDTELVEYFIMHRVVCNIYIEWQYLEIVVYYMCALYKANHIKS